jgi:hypothetical protein
MLIHSTGNKYINPYAPPLETSNEYRNIKFDQEVHTQECCFCGLGVSNSESDM